MFRVGLIRANGIPQAQNFPTREEAEEFLLKLMETEQLRQARIKDTITGEEERII
jgi:hypothetical protein